MIQETVKSYTNSSLAILAQSCKSLNQLKQIHAQIIKFHLPENPAAIGPILHVAATSNNASFFSYARSIFQNLQFRNTFMYNTMIRGYVQSDLPSAAISCYVNMFNHGFIANHYTFTPLIKACSMSAHRSSRSAGCLIHAHVVKLGFSLYPFIVSSLIEFYSLILDMNSARYLFDKIPDKDVVLWTAMIDGYGKAGETNNARQLFDEMPERNTISWSSIMAAYSRSSNFKEVTYLFRKMLEHNVKLNDSILVTVLTACAHLGALAQGQWIHSYTNRHSLEKNPILATALVQMYSKCGHIEPAISIFEKIQNKDIGSWNAIISGIALNGNPSKSLEFFDQMVQNGARPNETTFATVLTACSHARFVKEGLLLFKQMGRVYRVNPRLEHYACVVDLLARAGRLEEAERLVMEEIGDGGSCVGKWDANVYGALLGGCRIHGKVEIGNRVWKRLCEMGVAASSGAHVVSYNMYKEAGWEEEAEGVRRFMAESGMRKTPGCSLIEVEGVLEEFLAGDILRPKGKEICKMLDSLFKVACVVE